MSGEGKVVCVTGASGFIASWLVNFLLERGYTVKATVRNPDDPKKVEHLLALDGAKERLHLVKANLLEEGAFDAAVEGCEGVFHTASPFYEDPKDPQAELVDPAVKGTLNVLNSCVKFPSIKRVILTSSMAAVVCNKRPKTPEVVVDESWYSDLDFCRQLQLWYVLSKTMAEDAAWRFVQERGIDMVVINPGMVSGPLLQPTLNTSAAIVANLFNGAETYPNAVFGWVDVRNVVTAHILAFETPSAYGRYCLVESTIHFSELVKILREHYPNAPLPHKCANNNPLAQTYQIAYDKTKSLGVEYIPLKVSLRDTAESLKKKGFVNICGHLSSSL